MADPRDFRRTGTAETTYDPEKGNGGGLKPAPMASTNTFIPPTRTTMSADAVNALAQIEPALTGFFDRRATDQANSDVEAGRQKALELAMSDGEAIKQGKLQPNQSKWFMKGYKAQYGENLGQQWAAEAKVGWEQSEAKNSDKPEAVSQYLAEFTAKKLQDPASQDPDIRAGILPWIQRTRTVLTAAQGEYSANRVKEQHLENVGIAINNDIDLYRQGKMTKDQLLDSIKQRDSAGRLIGVSNDDMNKTVLLAVTDKAHKAGDMGLLKILTDYQHIGNNPKYGPQIRKTEDAIISKSVQLENLAWTREQRARQERERVGLVEVYDAFLDQQKKGGEITMTPQIEAAIKKTGAPDAYTKGFAFMKHMKENAQEMTVQQMNDVSQRLINSGTGALAQLDYEVEAKSIKNIGAYQQMRSIAMASRDLTNDRSFLDFTNRILQYGGKDQFGKAMIDPYAAEQHANEFRRRYIEYVAANPASNPQQRDEFSRTISETLMKELDKYKTASGKTNYNGIDPKLRSMSNEELRKALPYSTPSK